MVNVVCCLLVDLRCFLLKQVEVEDDDKRGRAIQMASMLMEEDKMGCDSKRWKM